jgi:hypothetical protein
VSHPYHTALRCFLKHLAPPWSKPQRGNFLRLAAAFLKRRSLPLRRLARSETGPNRTCRPLDRRFRRFLGSDRLDVPATLEAYLVFLLPRFGPVAFVPVVLDWTFVKGHALLWAQIPYRGRSFPLLVAVYPATKLDPEATFQTEAEMALLQTLAACWPVWAPPPLLVADRGFDKGPLLAWLVHRHWLFLIRGKRQPLCLDARGQRIPATRLTEPGATQLFPHIRYYAAYHLRLHLVVAGAWDPKTGLPTEWRLVTNLPEAVLPHAARLYHDRMQPEETHRDCKRGHFVSGFALSHLGRMRADRLERYLFLLGLIYCFLILVAETDRATRQWFLDRHWGLSLITFALDLLHAPGVRLRSLVRQALSWALLQPQWAESGDC